MILSHKAERISCCDWSTDFIINSIYIQNCRFVTWAPIIARKWERVSPEIGLIYCQKRTLWDWNWRLQSNGAFNLCAGQVVKIIRNYYVDRQMRNQLNWWSNIWFQVYLSCTCFYISREYLSNNIQLLPFYSNW